MKKIVLSALLLAALSNTVLAQNTGDLAQQGDAAYANRNFARAATLYMQAFNTDHKQPINLYNAASAYALAGDKENAFSALRRALANGFTDGDSAERNNDFVSLRSDTRWPGLIAELKAADAGEAVMWNSTALATPYQENISDDEKIAGLSKFWAEVKYNFIYADKLKELDWDRLYLDYLPRVRATKSTAAYYRVLMELCARLQDGHTNVYPAQQVLNTQLARPLIRTRLVEGRVMVTDVFDEALRDKGITPDVEITAVDGETVKTYAEREISPYQSASTAQDLAIRTYRYAFLSGPIAIAPRVTFRGKTGKTFDVALQRYDAKAVSSVRPPVAPFEFRMLPGGVAYVALNSFEDQRAADGFIAAFVEIAKSSALIIDVRNNGGGNSDVGYRVLATIAAQPFETGKSRTRNYVPTYRAWKRPMPDLEINENAQPIDQTHRYDKPVIVLTSAATYSAAEDFAIAFDAMKRGQIVGEATGGSTGQPLFINLPGGGMARICTKADTYPDGKKWIGIGIQPNIAVSQTVADLHSRRDTVLEAALVTLKK